MHKPISLLLNLILLLLVIANSAGATDLDANYEILLTQNQSVMTVKACFAKPLPEVLVNHTTGASGLLKKAYVVIDDLPQSLVIRNGRILLNGLYGQQCLHYQVDFLRVMQMNHDYRYMPENINHARTRAGFWLWLPEKFSVIDLLFHLEEDYAVTAPWKLIEQQKATARFRLQANNDNAESLVYFGRMKQQQFYQGESLVRVNFMSQIDDNTEKKLLDWIKYGATSLTKIYDVFPLSQLSVMVFPIGKNNSTVPWGEVKRDGGTSVHLYVDQTKPLSVITKDWTLLHELSHTLHPYISMEGRWLSEGLASYYQNVLQARAGTISVNRAWTKLHQGFLRGQAESQKGKKLLSISRDMRKNKQYMRVYWSGAALWLRADWLLRTRHDSSLDQVMLKLRQCCLTTGRTWSAEEFMQKLDQLSDTDMFTSMYTSYSRSDQFPNMSDVYRSLGLKENGKRLGFHEAAPNHNLIQIIMNHSSI